MLVFTKGAHPLRLPLISLINLLNYQSDGVNFSGKSDLTHCNVVWIDGIRLSDLSSPNGGLTFPTDVSIAKHLTKESSV